MFTKTLLPTPYALVLFPLTFGYIFHQFLILITEWNHVLSIYIKSLLFATNTRMIRMGGFCAEFVNKVLSNNKKKFLCQKAITETFFQWSNL